MYWAAEASTAAGNPTLALISAAGAVLTATLPVLVSKMRDRSQPAPTPQPPPAPSGTDDGGGRHRVQTSATELTAYLEEGGSLLKGLITDVRDRAVTAETELRAQRVRNDELESENYRLRWQVQALEQQIQVMTSRGLR